MQVRKQVRTGHGTTDWFQIGKGVRQGCIFSPCLFNFYAESHPEYAVNVQALTQVQPKELDASEIEVRIGATWIDPKYIEDFMRETFETPQHLLDRNVMGIHIPM